ncbi:MULTISPECIES: hypothetical protein [Halorussus]|uniref:hypothetical protein n=1 Tax=Halorussus TaxID=1070314 RepID=UPI0020A07CF4|nr:hypothetical protein [Halorussus vallis]USZ77256.1 hypothetical protein NGM07_07970 [Halorussus vallis]
MIGDDNSVVAVVVLPALSGVLGFVAAGPLGFLVGASLVLVVGGMVDYEDESAARIAELEARVAKLETELAANASDESGDSSDAAERPDGDPSDADEGSR